MYILYNYELAYYYRHWSRVVAEPLAGIYCPCLQVMMHYDHIVGYGLVAFLRSVVFVLAFMYMYLYRLLGIHPPPVPGIPPCQALGEGIIAVVGVCQALGEGVIAVEYAQHWGKGSLLWERESLLC